MSKKHSQVYPEVVPGVIITWISKTAEPDINLFLECNGAYLLHTTGDRYQGLFDVIGYTYGGSGSTFYLPDYSGKFLRGSTPTKPVGLSETQNLAGHYHFATSGPVYSYSSTGTSHRVEELLRWDTSPEIGRSYSISEGNLGTKVLPKTMYVKYYISY